MWIRSQDKRQLVNANDLYIATRGKGYCISTGKGNDLGTYSSEAKAIKALDYIQYNGIGSKWVEMPKEDSWGESDF